MQIGILKADSVLPQFQARHGDYPLMIAAVLGPAAAAMAIDATFRTYDVEHGHYPARPDECAGYIVPSSRKSVYDDEPWMRELGAYIQTLHAAKARLVGLCFGHQMIAHYLGGRVEAAAAGWGVGIRTSRLLSHAWFMAPSMDPSMAGLPDDYSLIVSHQDQVVTLPEGAELIASSDFCPNEMFCLGDHILALQGHPEFNRDYARELMAYRQDILGPGKYNPGLASLKGHLSRATVARWIMRFLAPKIDTASYNSQVA